MFLMLVKIREPGNVNQATISGMITGVALDSDVVALADADMVCVQFIIGGCVPKY
jgi:hypothetical protein